MQPPSLKSKVHSSFQWPGEKQLHWLQKKMIVCKLMGNHPSFNLIYNLSKLFMESDTNFKSSSILHDFYFVNYVPFRVKQMRNQGKGISFTLKTCTKYISKSQFVASIIHRKHPKNGTNNKLQDAVKRQELQNKLISFSQNILLFKKRRK